MNTPNDNEPTQKLDAEVPRPQGSGEIADLPIDSITGLTPKAAAEEARPLALLWLTNAMQMLRIAVRAFEPDPPSDIRIALAIETIRRHFHTDRRKPELSETAAIKLLDRNFQAMHRFLSTSDSIFRTADDRTAADNTRGYFGSGLTVAAYAYTRNSISFTSHYPELGPLCKAAVIIHQLAFFIDARIRDHSSGGLIYDLADFDTSIFNVHCYPNFAINATPPYLDERFGMTRPEL